jgi:diguanylate cyclase (GGDEF)-like protein
MDRKRLRLAVLMNVAFSHFQEEPKIGIDRYAAMVGIDVVYFGMGSLDMGSSEDRARSAFFRFITPDVFDGLIPMSSFLMNSGYSAIKEALDKLKPMPMVSIGPSISGEDNIIADSRSGILAVMRHLIIDHGIREFAFVSGPGPNVEAAARLKAFRDSLDEAGIKRDDEIEYEGNFMPPSGTDAVHQFLDVRGLKPKAIVCANDFMAIGVRDGLIARGLTVPYDVAVTGFDDVNMFHALSHQFTTVRQSYDAMGYAAAARLHAILRGDRLDPPRPLPVNLLVRSSCGCVDLQDRKTSIDAGGDAALSSMKEKIESIASAGFPKGGAFALQRSWVSAIQNAILNNRSASGLEEALRRVQKSPPPGVGREAIEAFLLKLHGILEEESAQTMVALYWRDAFTSLTIRLAIDDLQAAIFWSLSWDLPETLFMEICRRSKARRFHLLRFVDGNDIEKGATVVFSHDDDSAASGPERPWRPGPGAWFPESAGSLVANMITDGEDRFGYFLLDANAIGQETFENLRIRLSGIHHDARILLNVREVNQKMASEISIRQNSESKLKDALAMVERMAIRDQLTDLNNRRGFLALAEQQIKLMRRQKDDLLLLYADLDGLKAINDRWGHKEGDLAIQGAARALRESLRDSDLVARIGGDEFTALICQADRSSISIIKDRIRGNCEKISLEFGREWKIALSVGFYYAAHDCGYDVETMMAMADAILYEEKKRQK